MREIAEFGKREVCPFGSHYCFIPGGVCVFSGMLGSSRPLSCLAKMMRLHFQDSAFKGEM
jgi:hypothetical protein